MQKAVEAQFVNAKIRLDGSAETAGGALFLPLLPVSPGNKKGKVEVDSLYPEGKNPDIVFYSNGWAHIKLTHKGEASTISLAKEIPDKIRKKLDSLHFPSDLIVPQGFVLPRSLKGLTQTLGTISLVDDAAFYAPDFGTKPKAASRENYKGNGTLFLTSITAGSITMLDGKTLEKIAELPTEGTPCSLDLCNGQIYVTDQAKSRLLVIDPLTRKFAGQVNLAPRSAPKGVAALPNGKWIYVSESGAGDVVSIETATGKVLVKTKTHPGPGRLAVTPDGTFLFVLNVTSGEVTMMSTYNQQVVSTIKTGGMPTSIVISHDSKQAYVTNRMSNTVSVIDVPYHRVMKVINTGQSPTGIALNADSSHLFVASGRDNTITEYDTKTLAKLREVHTPTDVDFPGYMCMLPDNKRLLICSQQTDALVVLDIEKMEFEAPIGLGHPHHEAVWEPVP